MPPKQGPQVNELTEKNVAVLRAALCCVDEFKPNWALALHKFGVGKGGHGPRDFKLALAKLGLVYDNKKISLAPGIVARTDWVPGAPPPSIKDDPDDDKKKAGGAGTKRKAVRFEDEEDGIGDVVEENANKRQKKQAKGLVPGVKGDNGPIDIKTRHLLDAIWEENKDL